MPEEDTCLTETNEVCIFPFKFNNATYYQCTWDYSNSAWCSTKVDASGVHVGGSKGICESGCLVKPKSQVLKKLTSSSYFDTLKDILFRDLGIEKSVVESDWEYKYICGENNENKDARENVMISLKNSSRIKTYRQLCEDPAWNGLKGVQFESSLANFIHCKGYRPSQYFISNGKCDGAYDCIDRSDETECVEGHKKYQKFDKIWSFIFLRILKKQPVIHRITIIK